MERLFVYGSLQPGGPNEHVLAGLDGDWQPAVLKGRLVEAGWGSGLGYPGAIIDDSDDEIRGHLLTSAGLAGMWSELDAFEGSEYQRVVAPVTPQGGEPASANVYVLRG